QVIALHRPAVVLPGARPGRADEGGDAAERRRELGAPAVEQSAWEGLARLGVQLLQELDQTHVSRLVRIGSGASHVATQPGVEPGVSKPRRGVHRTAPIRHAWPDPARPLPARSPRCWRSAPATVIRATPMR